MKKMFFFLIFFYKRVSAWLRVMNFVELEVNVPRTIGFLRDEKFDISPLEFNSRKSRQYLTN